MPREFPRHVRIAQAIHRILAPEFTRLARAAGVGMTTITDVTVASDLSVATLFVSVYGEQAKSAALEPLRAALPQMRSLIARDLRLKKVPTLVLEFDETVARGARISELLASRPTRADS